MERLTSKCWRDLHPWECCGQDNYCARGSHDEGGCANGCIVPKLYFRLARYEDTGLEPEAVKCIWESLIGAISAEIAEEQGYVEVNRAKEIACAEAEGRLVIPPCKLGDTVWALHTGFNTNFLHVYQGRCIEISQSFLNGSAVENYVVDFFDFKDRLYESDIGLRMFFSEAEADAALKKIREEKHGTTD